MFGSNGVVGIHDEALYQEAGVVVGRKGSAGAAALSMKPCFPIDTTFYLRPRGGGAILPEFLYLVIDHHRFPTGGSGVPSLSKSKLSRYQIPVPPIADQRAIVDTVFAREGTDPQNPGAVSDNKDEAFRREFLTQQLGW